MRHVSYFRLITTINEAGAIEQDKFEHAIKELESACDRFIPASERYKEKIYGVLAELNIHESLATIH